MIRTTANSLPSTLPNYLIYMAQVFLLLRRTTTDEIFEIHPPYVWQSHSSILSSYGYLEGNWIKS